MVWKRKGLHDQNVVHIDQGDTIEANKIIGEQCAATTEWLRRSLSCTTWEPIEGSTMHTELVVKKGLQAQLRLLSCMQVILTFPSEQLMEAYLRHCDELGQWFKSIEKWSITDKAQYRRTWIEVFGVPIHGWTKENFQKIAVIWGKLISLESMDVSIPSYESMKMLIATDHVHQIHGDILFQVGNTGYRVVVTEIGPAISKGLLYQGNLTQQGPIDAASLGKNTAEAMQRNSARWNQEGLFNDNEVEVVQESNMLGSHAQKDNEQQICIEAQRVPRIQNSKGKTNHASPLTVSSGSDLSVTKTKSLGCSLNEGAKEALITLLDQGMCAHPTHTQPNSAEEIEQAGKGDANQENIDSTDEAEPSGAPPGFELPSRQSEVTPEHTSLHRTSNLSSDNAEKQAKEALQIGNLLGLRIVHNAKVAEERITRTLRSHSKKQQQKAEKSSNHTQKSRGR